jgi:hypothetical protein
MPTAIARVGLDIAKPVLHVYATDHDDRILVRRKLRRDEVEAFFQPLYPCLVGMEARPGASLGPPHSEHRPWVCLMSSDLTRLGSRLRVLFPDDDRHQTAHEGPQLGTVQGAELPEASEVQFGQATGTRG